VKAYPVIPAQLLNRGRWAGAVFLLLILFPPMSSAGPTQVMLTSSENPQGSASDGESLFIGRTHFLNRGPACISCHSIAGLPFPNGGTLGPDLTQTYAKLGPAGTQAAMQTLYFPTMIPVYRDHQLAPQEQADMVAYFRATAAEAKPQAQWTTQMLILAAFVLGTIFVALTAFFWRKRVLSVRRALVARATGQGVRS
jgi:mono/diheme cytochrome c family protein